MSDLCGVYQKEKKPVKPKPFEVFQGCQCRKKKLSVKQGKKIVSVKKKKKR